MSSTNRAFSLFELLTAVCIIAILCSILFPVLEMVRRQARMVKCASNLRQIWMAAVSYAADERGLVVRSGWTDVPGGPPTNFWHGYLGPYAEASQTSGTTIYDLRQRNSVLWGCPEYTINPNTPWYSGYGFNCWLKEPVKDPSWRMYTNAWLGSSWNGNWNMGVFSEFKFAALTNSSTRPLIGDRDDDWTIYYAAGLPHVRHHGDTNILFCDGHVGTLRATVVRAMVQNPQ